MNLADAYSSYRYLPMDIRLTDLENFIAIASCSSLSEGARKRGITQPALSESIRRLERDVGCILLYRSKSGISLTPSGRSIRERGRRALEALSELTDPSPADEAAGIFAGRSVTIGCHPLVASYALPPALAALSRLAPDFRVDLVHDFSRVLQGQIQSGRVDVGIIVNPTQVPDLIIRRLASDTVAVWETKSRAARNRLICDPNLFQTQAILRKWKRCPSDVISTTSLELIARLAEQGLGYGIIPERAVRLVGARLRKVAAAPTYRDELSLVHRPEFGKLPCERAVLKALAGALG